MENVAVVATVSHCCGGKYTIQAGLSSALKRQKTGPSLFHRFWQLFSAQVSLNRVVQVEVVQRNTSVVRNNDNRLSRTEGSKYSLMDSIKSRYTQTKRLE